VDEQSVTGTIKQYSYQPGFETFDNMHSVTYGQYQAAIDVISTEDLASWQQRWQ